MFPQDLAEYRPLNPWSLIPSTLECRVEAYTVTPSTFRCYSFSQMLQQQLTLHEKVLLLSSSAAYSFVTKRETNNGVNCSRRKLEPNSVRQRFGKHKLAYGALDSVDFVFKPVINFTLNCAVLEE